MKSPTTMTTAASGRFTTTVDCGSIGSRVTRAFLRAAAGSSASGSGAASTGGSTFREVNRRFSDQAGASLSWACPAAGAARPMTMASAAEAKVRAGNW